MKLQAFLISGVFFQDTQSLTPSVDQTGGIALIANHPNAPHMFYGWTWSDPQSALASYVGELTDCYGRSTIFNFKVDEHQVSFVKRYDRRDDEIIYEFERGVDGVYVGGYQGNEEVGKGMATCIITPIPQVFFYPPLLAKYIGRIHHYQGLLELGVGGQDHRLDHLG